MNIGIEIINEVKSQVLEDYSAHVLAVGHKSLKAGIFGKSIRQVVFDVKVC